MTFEEPLTTRTPNAARQAGPALPLAGLQMVPVSALTDQLRRSRTPRAAPPVDQLQLPAPQAPPRPAAAPTVVDYRVAGDIAWRGPVRLAARHVDATARMAAVVLMTLAIALLPSLAILGGLRAAGRARQIEMPRVPGLNAPLP